MLKNVRFIILAALLFSCGEKYKPKPFGELRLEYPAPHYIPFKSNSPFSFEYSNVAEISEAQKKNWYNLRYPKMKANVFITYFPVHGDLKHHIKEAEKMVYQHTIRASAIKTTSFSYPEHKAYGNYYELKGQSASNIQFFVTDSLHHFVTANLYFNTRPKPDSLAPAIAYIARDLKHMIATFQWKN